MTPRQPDDPGPGEDDGLYSDDPFTPAEWRALRREIAKAREREEALDAIIETWRAAGRIRRLVWIICAWIVGGFVTLLGILTALKELDLWNGKGGP